MMIMDEVDKNLDISTEKCNLNIRTVDQSNRSVQSDVGGTTYEVALLTVRLLDLLTSISLGHCCKQYFLQINR